MKTYRVMIPNERIDFFKELMSRLGIQAEPEDIGKRSHVASQLGKSESEGSSEEMHQRKLAALKTDSSIQDVLKKIEEIRSKNR